LRRRCSFVSTALADGGVTGIVTVTKQMVLKATVGETGYVREYGPCPVR